MIVVVDHFVELGNIGVIELCPQLDLRVHFVEIIYHLHLSFFIVANSPLSLKCRFMHHFHRELYKLLIYLVISIETGSSPSTTPAGFRAGSRA